MRSEEEREQGRQFSEMLRQRYEASRYGIEWLRQSGSEDKPRDPDPDEAEE